MRNKVTFAVMCLVIISILATGCQTTTQRSSGIGAGIGTALGAGIGALLGDPGLGMAIGAGAGALGGALVGDQLDKKREEAEKAELERQLELERKAGSGEGKNYIDLNQRKGGRYDIGLFYGHLFVAVLFSTRAVRRRAAI
jgi:uncharacterized protein YcfJ